MVKKVKPGEGLKYDDEKLRWDLLPYEIMEEVVKVLTFGAQKYKINNWKKVECGKMRYFAAAMRHLVAWYKGEENDSETGLNHLAHAICSIIFVFWHSKYECKGSKDESIL